MTDHVENWIGDRFFNGDRKDESVSMKPALAALMVEAFWIAIGDSSSDLDDARLLEIVNNRDITDEEWSEVDPGILIRNLTNRMFGIGGWTVRGKYAAAHKDKMMVDACLDHPKLPEPEDELELELDTSSAFPKSGDDLAKLLLEIRKHIATAAKHNICNRKLQASAALANAVSLIDSGLEDDD